MKFILDHIFLVGAVIVSGGLLLWPSLQARGKRASALEVTQLINRGKAVVVDVRDPLEFANGHLRDSKNISLKELPARIGELEKFKTKSIILICQSGARSGAAAKAFQKAGFEDVVCLDGGLAAWQTQGLPIAK